MNIPHVVPQEDLVGMMLMVPCFHIMMNPFGINTQVLVFKWSMEITLRNPSSISWNTML